MIKNTKTEAALKVLLYVIFFITLYAGALWLSWAITSFIVKMICHCFGWPFTKSIGTEVWLIMMLVESVLITLRKEQH